MPSSSVHERKRKFKLTFKSIFYTIGLTNYYSCKGDPLVHHGRHFCRTIHAMCNIHALLTQSIIREVEQVEATDEDFSVEFVVVFFAYLNSTADHPSGLPTESAASMQCSKNC